MQRLWSSLRATGYSITLLYVANALLLLELIRFRSARIADSDVPYFSLSFVILFGAALALAISSIAATRLERLQTMWRSARRTVRWLVAVVMAVGGFAALAALANLAPSLRNYIPPFLIWLLLVSVALLIRLLFKEGPATPFVAWLSQRWGQLAGGVLLLALSVLGPLLLLEIGFRIWFSYFGTEHERIIYTYSWHDISRLTGRFRGVPYLNFGLSLDYPGHNPQGYRGREVAIPKPEGVFRIVAIGGSTTYGDLRGDHWEDAYPVQLERILRDSYGYSQVEVINAGVPSYTTWEILVNMAFRVLDLEPDLVIFYEGVNELQPRVLPSEYYTGLAAHVGIWRTDAPNLSPSVLYRYLAINLGWMQDPTTIQYRFQPQFPEVHCCEGIPDEELAHRIANNPPIYFERNLRNLIAIAQASGVQVLLSSWVYFPDPTEGGPGVNLMTLEYRQEAITEQNAVTRRLAEEMDVPFYDLNANFPYNPDFWFWDGIHMTLRGTHEQAQQYAAFMIEQGLLQPQS